MSIKKVMTCDVCGEAIDLAPGIPTLKLRRKWSIGRFVRYGKDWATNIDIDVCDRCYEEFLRWLDEVTK